MDPMLDDFRAVARGPHVQPADACRSSPTSPASSPARRSPPRVLGPARPRSRALRRRHPRPRQRSASPARSRSAPAARSPRSRARSPTRRSRPTLRAKRPEPEAFADLIAHAHLTGLTPDWHALAPARAQRVDLPTYAFQRQHFWLTGDPAGDDGLDHPLLSARLQLAGEDRWAFTGRLSLATHPWLADHKVFGTVLLPGTGLVELALAAGERVDCPVRRRPDARGAARPSRAGPLELQVVVGEGERREIGIFTRPDGDAARLGAPRRRRARARRTHDVPELDVAARGRGAAPRRGALRPAGRHRLRLRPAVPGRRRRLAARRRGLRRGRAREAEDADRYGIHPALFDALFHAAIDALTARRRAGHAAAAVRVQRRPARAAPALPPCAPRSRRSATAASSSTAADAHGRPVLAVRRSSHAPGRRRAAGQGRRPGRAPALRGGLARDRGRRRGGDRASPAPGDEAGRGGTRDRRTPRSSVLPRAGRRRTTRRRSCSSPAARSP